MERDHGLPAPEAAPSENEVDFEPPATAVEESVAVLWSELLGIKRVGRRDNFFECGGDSLLAMQLVVRIHYAKIARYCKGVHSVTELEDCPTGRLGVQ